MSLILLYPGVVKGAESLRAKVLEHSRRLRHRGPDWSGVYVKGENILSHERLAIVDVENGAQPLKTEDGQVILAVNGEIYNHKELRKGLKSPGKFLTSSDCEVIMHLYLEQGLDFLQKLNGIWAFVLVDEKTGRTVIARDHMGIIPLYIGHDKDGNMWVASELKALHDVCVSFEDFPPGHVYDSETGETSQWYEPKWWDENRCPDNKMDIKGLHDKMYEAVERQLMSDVPYGVLLSGGLDSSIVSAIAAKVCEKKKAASAAEGKSATWWPQLHSFSIGLETSPDLKAARKVAEHIGTVHHEFVFTVQEGLDALSDVIRHLETYDVTTCRAATPMYLMSRKIKCLGVKMVLSGEGADEAFGGYLYFHKCPNRAEMQRENVRKLKDLYKFDCLRANKSTAAWGVEARVPFLDIEYLDYVMGEINPSDKMCGKNADGRIEKWILRKAFEDYLPDEIVWRQKEQFSDGVGYSWIDGMKAHAEKLVSDQDMKSAKFRFPHNTPPTKEAFMIRSMFEHHFPSPSAAAAVPGGPSVACSTPTAILWDESFKKFADCSGRSVVGVHASAYDEKHRDSGIVGELSTSDMVFAEAHSKRKGTSSSEIPAKKAKTV